MSKQGTPTMGGFLIWVGLLLGTLLFADLQQSHISGSFSPFRCLTRFSASWTIMPKSPSRARTAFRRVCGSAPNSLSPLQAGAFIMGLHGAHTPLGHADWGALNPLAEWIAHLRARDLSGAQ